jgi:hypothetical protein
MRLAAFLLLSFSCFGQSPGRKLPSHVRLMDGPSLSAPTKTPIPVPIKTRARVNAYVADPSVADGRCAHILVKPVTPDLDPKVIIPVHPSEGQSAMPTFHGLPACPQDIR